MNYPLTLSRGTLYIDRKTGEDSCTIYWVRFLKHKHDLRGFAICPICQGGPAFKMPWHCWWAETACNLPWRVRDIAVQRLRPKSGGVELLA